MAQWPSFNYLNVCRANGTPELPKGMPTATLWLINPRQGDFVRLKQFR
ncbi:hypothetical protein BGHDH14_bgh02629 [Blumeria hordei DH14]|uniref:Uncharacterized protein n=1 Tax=Blumeria graminis f. sp. hordei (strain DH14) TaxID=546991 RepID=N1JA63_BLUG1|nr:hypothetical protein BGHDH14_bgh02629 [Blumeria hordei DH14]